VAKENKHDLLETSSPTGHPTELPTAHPSVALNPPSGKPSKEPTGKQTEAPVQLPTSDKNTLNPTPNTNFESPNSNLLPFVLEFNKFPINGTALDQFVERYLRVSLKAVMPSLVDVELETLNTNRKGRGLQANMIRAYYGSVTIGDPSVNGPFVRTAQTTVLEDIATLNLFLSNADIDVSITRVQVGDREPVFYPMENQTDEIARAAPNIGLVAPVAIAVLFIVVATVMLILYRRNKTPQPLPYFFEEDSESSISLDEGIERFGKSRTIETEAEQTSPCERPSLRRLSSARFLIQECLAEGGMEVVQLDSEEDDGLVQLASYTVISPSQSVDIRSHSPSSMSVFSNSNDSTALRSSAMRCGRSRTVEGHAENISAQLSLACTKSVAAIFMLGSSSASYTDDSINEVEDSCLGRMEEPAEDIFVRRDPAHDSCITPHSHMHHIPCTKSEETERRFNPPNKWLAPQPRQPPLSLQDELLHSESSTMAYASTMALESVLNPVRPSQETGDREIDVFVDSDSVSQNSGVDKDGYNGDSEDDSLAPELVKSVGSIHQANSFGSEPSDQKRSLPMLNLNQKLLGCESNGQKDEIDAEPRIVSPTASSHENASDEENEAPSDEETRFMQLRNSFEYSQTGSVHSERDVFEESTLFPTLNSTMDSISYSSSSVASQDSSSRFDTVFMEQLKWEKQRAKVATRKLQLEEKHISFDMDL